MKTYMQKFLAVLMMITLLLAGIQTNAGSDEAGNIQLSEILRIADQINGAYDQDSGLLYVEKEDHIEVKQYAGFSPTVVIPREIAGKPVTVVSLESCSGGAWGNFFQGIVKIVLPDTIVRLDKLAFYALDSLREVEGLEYVRELGSYVFEQCGLTEAHFSANLKKIDLNAFFNDCLKHVTLPDDIEINIQQFLFEDSLEELKLIRGIGTPTIKLVDKVLYSPDGETLIRLLPNYRSSSFVIPDGVKKTDRYAFFGLQMVQDYTFPDSVTEIEDPNFGPWDIIVRANKGSYAWKYFSEMYTGYAIDLRDLSAASLSAMAQKVVSEVVTDGMSEWDKAFALHNWILAHTTYDESITYHDAETLFTQGIGVCESYARAYSALLNEAGIENRFISCVMKDALHAINAVKIEGSWCYVDCTNDDTGTVGSPYYLFGFNDTLYYQVYQGGTGVTAAGTASYAPFRKGVLDQYEKELTAVIQATLDKGERTFTVDASNAVGKFASYMMADRMQEKAWKFNGKKMSVNCRLSDPDGEGKRVYSISLILPDTENFKYVQTQDGKGICLTEYLGSAEEVTVPDTLDGHKVLALKGTFSGQQQLKKVVLPNTLQEIGDDTFRNCTALLSINFPSWLRRIGAHAFDGCTSLQTDAVLPNTVKEIGNAAFFKCMSLSGVLIPGGVENIGVEVFAECQNLSRVTLVSGVKSIPDGMFAYCLRLSSLKLPSTLESIGYGAFTMSGINALEIPASVSAIDSTAFIGAKHLKSLKVDEKNRQYCATGNMLLSRDKKNLIAGTRGVNPDLQIPKGVKEIGEQAFVFIPLKSITIPTGVKKIGYKAFAGDNTYTTVIMADTVEEIGSFAFGAWEACGIGYYAVGCEYNHLKSIRLSKGLKKIGAYAFAGTKLNQLILPDSLTSIDCSIINQPICLYIPASVTSIAEQNIVYGLDGFEIHGYAGSAAEKYAKMYQVPFINEDKHISFDTQQLVLLPAEHYVPTMHLGDGTVVQPSEVIWEVTGDCVKAENGTLVALTPGKADLKVSWNGYEGNCTVCVADPDNYHFLGDHYGIDHDGALLLPNNIYNLLFEVSVPESGSGSIVMNDHVLWSVSDDSIIRFITPGVLEVVGCGEASFSVTLPNGTVYSLSVETIAAGPTAAPGPEITPIPYMDTVTVSNGKYALNHKKLTAVFTGLSKDSVAKVTIPAEVEANGNTYKVTEIAAKACKGKKLKSVSIGENVSKIGKNAFRDCSKLKTVTGLENVTKLEESAFRNCAVLTSVRLSAKIRSLGKDVFNGCRKLTTVSGGTTLTAISDGAFRNCVKLSAFAVGPKVKTIGASAFSGCTALKKITGGKALVTIGSSAFESCTALESFTLESKVKNIGAKAFCKCKNIKTFTIRTVNLTDKTVGAKAFATGTAATYNCPKKKLKAYQKLLPSKGAHKKSTYQ